LPRETIAIEGVWLLKQTGENGKISVLVEVEGKLYEAIQETADDGPISHHVFPAGITNKKVVEL
jgi:hypothetical protein